VSVLTGTLCESLGELIMRVYYFTNEEFGLSNIINERLKISLLDDLNDPFEFFGINLSDKAFRKAFEAARENTAKMSGVICFCRDWQNPLMWGHYGDKHKGICLGFDIDDTNIKEIEYCPDRLSPELDMNKRFCGLTEELVEKLMFTKFKGWGYENEVRVSVSLEERDSSGLYFTDFKGNMELKEIFLGLRSNLNVDQIAKYLCSFETEVNVYKTKAAFTKYEVVKDLSKSVYKHSPNKKINKD
jgi:hypothetical protein